MGCTMIAPPSARAKCIHRMSWNMDESGYYRIFKGMTDKLIN